MNCLEFLKRILPDEGLYAGVIIVGKDVRQTIFDTIEDLHGFIHDNCYNNVYFGCSSFLERKPKTASKKPEVRTKANVHRIKSLWIDIDARPGKEYNSPEEAIEAFKGFLQFAGLPEPIFVFTGGGFHVYWALDEALTKEQWEPYAQGLKNLCAKLNFKADPTRTADAASILRPIDTINTKYNTAVTLYRDTGTYPVSKFSKLLFHKDVAKEEKKQYTDLVEIEPILRGCAQIRAFEKGEKQSEPLWVSCGRVLSQCRDGEALWHKWSKQDERYDSREADKKWAESIHFGNAVNCSHFKAVNPSACDGCSFSGSTPVQLGRGNPVIDINPSDLPKLPDGYAWDDNKYLVRRTFTGEDENKIKQYKDTLVSRFPIIVDNRHVHEQVDDKYSLSVRTYATAGGWRSNNVSIVEMNERPAAALSKCDIPSVNTREVVQYLNACHEASRLREMPNKVFGTFGWKDGDKFLLGDKLFYIQDGELRQDDVGLGEDVRQLAGHLRPGSKKGSRPDGLQRWREGAQTLFARGHEWQAATLVIALATPLLHFVPDPEGGVVLSLAESVGGVGKTLATMAGITAWGDWSGLNCVPSDTLNARFAKIAMLGNIPVGFDEMRRDSAKISDDFVKQFTTGREKIRLNRDGLTGREPRTWRTILLTNANKELAGSIRAGKGSHAMADRVLELQAEPLPLKRDELSANLKEVFMTNTGYAGPCMIGLYLHSLDYIKHNMPIKADFYMRALGTTKDRFVAYLLAAFDICAQILENSEFFIFSAQELTDWLLKKVTTDEHVIEVKRSRTTSEDQLFRYIRENIDHALITTHYQRGRKSPVNSNLRGQLRMRIETDTKEIIIPRSGIEKFLEESQRSLVEFIRDLKKLKLIKDACAKKNIGAGTEYSSGQEYCIVFDSNHYLINPETVPQAGADEPV